MDSHLCCCRYVESFEICHIFHWLLLFLAASVFCCLSFLDLATLACLSTAAEVTHEASGTSCHEHCSCRSCCFATDPD